MQSDDYRIDVDKGRQLLRFAVIGYWSEETVKRFHFSLIHAVSQLGADMVVLADLRAAAVLSPAIVGEIVEATKQAGIYHHRTAILASAALVKMQSGRVSPPGTEFFQDEAVAIAWLLKDRG